MQNFGQRLRALIARRSLSPEQFWTEFGISRATYFNWIKREKPPPSRRHQEELQRFFGISPGYLLHGEPEALDQSKIGALIQDEVQAPYGATETLAEEARRHLDELLVSAGSDPRKLGWIIEQLRQHLAIPAGWQNPRLARIEPKTATGQRLPNPSHQSRSA